MTTIGVKLTGSRTQTSRRFGLFGWLLVAAITVLGAASARADSFPLYSFSGGNGGSQPSALTQGTDGNFYGTTSWGGTANNGTVFKLTPLGVLTTIYSFTGGTDDGCPVGPLVQGSDGNFYGATQGTGCHGDGTSGVVFKITPAGAFTMLHKFVGTDGAYTFGGLVRGADGSFYGTTYSGGADHGTVFKITSTGAFTVLHTFVGSDGGHSYAGLVLGRDGNFYGTTRYGGASNAGTVFKMTPAGIFTSLYSFTAGSDASDPISPLTQGTNGTFYGTTVGDCGPGCRGTVYSITPDGTFTTLYWFTISGGDWPEGLWPSNMESGLVQAGDGNFYGTTSWGGMGSPRQPGTVFMITPEGILTTLHSFDGIGGEENPLFGLTIGCDGNFYGTTPYGGTNNAGTMFELDGPIQSTTGDRCHQVSTMTLKANVEINRSHRPWLRPADSFEVEGRGTLSANSNGIAPDLENVTLSIGSLSWTIPAGSFVKTTGRDFDHGWWGDRDDDHWQGYRGRHHWWGDCFDRNPTYIFKGRINGVSFSVEIELGATRTFTFEFTGQRATFGYLRNPITVGLAIGDDAGHVVVRADID